LYFPLEALCKRSRNATHKTDGFNGSMHVHTYGLSVIGYRQEVQAKSTGTIRPVPCTLYYHRKSTVKKYTVPCTVLLKVQGNILGSSTSWGIMSWLCRAPPFPIRWKTLSCHRGTRGHCPELACVQKWKLEAESIGLADQKPGSPRAESLH